MADAIADPVGVDRLRQRLTLIWWWSAAVLTLLLISLNFMVGLPAAPQLWGWFLPNIIPVLTLVGTASAANLDQPDISQDEGKRRQQLAAGSSIFYLFLLSLTIIIMLFSGQLGDLIKFSGLWLAPFQGLATLALGFLFLGKTR